MKKEDYLELIKSNDYKERFKGEYYELEYRTTKLGNMINSYAEGTVPFTPTTPIEVLTLQLKHMMGYMEVLIERAKLEDIEL